jgi:polyisoprenoid-binding protein YceI
MSDQSAVAVAPTSVLPTGTWRVDPVHSSVEFQVKHLGIATVKGQFTEFEGTLEVGPDEVSAYGTVNVASVDTREPQRDEHLRSADFFDAAQYPALSFESTRIEAVDDESFRVTGNLTLHGVTAEIVLHADVQGTDIDPWGNERIGLEVSGQLSRGEFGMKFNQALGSGNMLVADKVNLALDISAVKQS